MKNLDYLTQVHFQHISLFVPHSCPTKNISHTQRNQGEYKKAISDLSPL